MGTTRPHFRRRFPPHIAHTADPYPALRRRRLATSNPGALVTGTSSTTAAHYNGYNHQHATGYVSRPSRNTASTSPCDQMRRGSTRCRARLYSQLWGGRHAPAIQVMPIKIEEPRAKVTQFVKVEVAHRAGGRRCDTGPPLAIRATGGALQLLGSHKWRCVQCSTERRGCLLARGSAGAETRFVCRRDGSVVATRWVAESGHAFCACGTNTRRRLRGWVVFTRLSLPRYVPGSAAGN